MTPYTLFVMMVAIACGVVIIGIAGIIVYIIAKLAILSMVGILAEDHDNPRQGKAIGSPFWKKVIK